MRKFTSVFTACMILSIASAAYAQRIDLSFGASTTTGPKASFNAVTGAITPSFARGTYLTFGGNVLFWHNLGANAEVTWRATRGSYDFGIFGSLPYRPLFYDFNAIYSPKFGRSRSPIMALCVSTSADRVAPKRR